jgi:TatD DNase family protein
MLFESHAHLDDEKFDPDRDQVIERVYNNGIKGIMNIGADLHSSSMSLNLAHKYGFICASCGIHPHEAHSYDDISENRLMEMLGDERAVAAGEIGLDYYYDKSDREMQREAFRRQLNLARIKKLPVIIHDREAHRDCLDIIKEENGYENGGVFHCYSGSAEMVREILSLGFHISFTGVITFSNARKTIEALKAVPLDRLLMETDCPYLAPVPNRGRRNDPSNLVYIAEKMAEVKDVDYETLCSITWENTLRLFPRFTFKT